MTPFKPLNKWRPRLSFVVGAVLLTVLALPVAALVLVGPGAGTADFSIWSLLPTFFVITSVTTLVGYVFVRVITGPVQELTNRTARLSAGDRSAIHPLNRHGSREIADLSSGLFGMACTLFDRTDYISNFATHVTHEVKTPLTSIRGAVELILDQGDGMSGEDRQRFLENILDDTQRITSLLDRLRELAYADNPHMGRAAMLNAVLRNLVPRYPDLSIVCDNSCDSAIPMTEENAFVVLSNLLDNAVQHKARTVVVKATVVDELLVVDVTDDGIGVSRGNQERIFELFFTTQREAGGTGIGLGIVRSMLAAHGGRIELLDERQAVPLQGAAFRLSIPTIHRDLCGSAFQMN